MQLILRKAHVAGFTRVDPRTGKTEHVDDYETKRQAHIAALQGHLEGLKGLVEAINRADERAKEKRVILSAPKVEVQPAKTWVKPAEEPPEPPDDDTSSPPSSGVKLAVPRAVTKAFMRMKAGVPLTQLAMEHRNHWTSQERIEVENWLSKLNHPAAKKEGAPSQRFHALMSDLFNRHQRRQGKEPEGPPGIAFFLTRDDKQQLLDLGYSRDDVAEMKPDQGKKIIAAGKTKKSGADAPVTQRRAFLNRLDALKDGSEIAIPNNVKGIETWIKRTVGGETLWRKKGGQKHITSEALVAHREHIEKQLPDLEKPEEPRLRVVKKPTASPLVSKEDRFEETETKPAGEAKPVKIPKHLLGNTVTAHTERGTAVETQYAVVSADDLISSHDTSLHADSRFPAELQPRQRERAASEDQVNRIASRLNPQFLGESPKASEGAPIVGPDMVVESGNGRTIALKRVYESGHENAAKYEDWLRANVEKFGLKADAVETVKSPVLVRVRTSDIDRKAFVQEANEQSVASMSASEQAKSDAQRMPDGLMGMFAPDDAGNIEAPSNRGFLRKFMQDVASAADRGRMLAVDGSLSQEGLTRVRNALLAKAYDNPDLLAKFVESTDSNIKNIGTAMLVAAPRFASLKEGIAKGDLHDVDISAELSKAAQTLSKLKEERTSVDDYLAQGSMFGPGPSALDKDMLRVLNEHARKPKQLGNLLRTYVEMAEAAGNPKQAGMFAAQAPTKAEMLEAALRKTGEADSDETLALFGGMRVGSK